MMEADMRRRVELTRVYHFSAAHCLANPALSEADNAALYGPCARPHGHNYYLEVTVAGVPDATTGFAIDLEALDRTVGGSLLDQVDHHRLEEAPALAGVITTGEGLARAFWGTLRDALPSGQLQRVVVQETAKNRFEYRGEEI
jgi:6-pyruvoyltetrahydropterin/6-carboxytetrahydropterin synthase